MVLDDDGEIDGRELAVAGYDVAVDDAERDLGRGAEDQRGDGIMERAGEVGIR